MALTLACNPPEKRVVEALPEPVLTTIPPPPPVVPHDPTADDPSTRDQISPKPHDSSQDKQRQ